MEKVVPYIPLERKNPAKLYRHTSSWIQLCWNSHIITIVNVINTYFILFLCCIAFFSELQKKINSNQVSIFVSLLCPSLSSSKSESGWRNLQSIVHFVTNLIRQQQHAHFNFFKFSFLFIFLDFISFYVYNLNTYNNICLCPTSVLLQIRVHRSVIM